MLSCLDSGELLGPSFGPGLGRMYSGWRETANSEVLAQSEPGKALYHLPLAPPARTPTAMYDLARHKVWGHRPGLCPAEILSLVGVRFKPRAQAPITRPWAPAPLDLSPVDLNLSPENSGLSGLWTEACQLSRVQRFAQPVRQMPR